MKGRPAVPDQLLCSACGEEKALAEFSSRARKHFERMGEADSAYALTLEGERIANIRMSYAHHPICTDAAAAAPQ